MERYVKQLYSWTEAVLQARENERVSAEAQGLDVETVPYSTGILAEAVGRPNEDLIRDLINEIGKLIGINMLYEDTKTSETLKKAEKEKPSVQVVSAESLSTKTLNDNAKAAKGQSITSDSQAALRESFAEILTDLRDTVKKGFADLKEAFSALAVPAPDPATEYEQQVQTITEDLIPALENLQNQYENNNLTVENYRSNLALLKDMYADYPEILAIVEDSENRLTEAQGNSISRTKALIENLEEASSAAQKQVDNLAGRRY